MALLTAEGVVAPVDSYTLLGTVSGIGGEDGAVTHPLWSTAANLRQTEADIGLPLHHVMTRLEGENETMSMCE